MKDLYTVSFSSKENKLYIMYGDKVMKVYDVSDLVDCVGAFDHFLNNKI